MKCPFCSHENTRVIDSRPAEDNNSIRRRRVCDECGKRFTTYEKIETIPLIIIKKDNNREAYDRAKIEAGVLRACHKRPVSAQQITTLVDEVENEIFNREEREIPSGTIGELVMNKLKDLDAVAYVRFASVYREFKDVNTFMDELKSVLAAGKGIIMADDPANLKYPMAIDCEDHDEVYVGRVRRDDSVENGLNLWVVADNIRKGAATNAVQIAEEYIRRNA